jgi:hypothetical protein
LAERLELLRAKGEWDPETKVYAPAGASREGVEDASDGVEGRVVGESVEGRVFGESVGRKTIREDTSPEEGTRVEGDTRIQVETPEGKEGISVRSVDSGKSDKPDLMLEAAMWSRAEIKWEKERRRKLNRAKKTKRKARGREADAESVEGSETRDV